MALLGNALILVASRFFVKPVSANLKLCVSLAAADVWAAFLIIIGR